MTKEKFDYIVETLREIKARSEERGYSGEVEALDAAISKLIATRWIPCSERMPENGKRVIVQISGSYGKRYGGEVFFENIISTGIYISDMFYSDPWSIDIVNTWGYNDLEYKVDAWQPFPEKYEEGK
jgi:hypothetical protein